MFREEYAKLNDCIFLSDRKISRRVHDMSNFCENELSWRLKSFEHRIIIQLVEIRDIALQSILLISVRYIDGTAAQKWYANLQKYINAEYR